MLRAVRRRRSNRLDGHQPRNRPPDCPRTRFQSASPPPDIFDHLALRDSVAAAVRAKDWPKAGSLIDGLLAEFPTDAEAVEWRKLMSEGRRSDLIAKLNPQRREPQPDIRAILDPIPVDRSVKAAAWDAWYAADTPDDFRTRFDKLPIPKESKAALWDAKFGGTAPVPPAPVVPPPAVRAGTTKVNPKDGLTYVWIPPGRFTMGCSPGDAECYDVERPAHEVTITRGFWLGQTPVTQQAYQRVTGQNPSHFRGANLPVDSADWDEAEAYCLAIGGRLPTEAEWEHAARARSTSARYGDLDEIAWYKGNSGNTTHEVGQKRPNAFGLYDMLGNVREWVADSFGNYESGAESDPSGAGSGQLKVLRGGSWLYDAASARVSCRARKEPGFRDGAILGLRCVGE